MTFKVLDLFSGIGGFALAGHPHGFETVAFCEIEPFCQKVLAKHWPSTPVYSDVRELTKEKLDADGITADVICGGFPCQDVSLASTSLDRDSRIKGIDGQRSGLWSECARLLREIQPEYAIFENVPNLLNGEGGDWFKRVLWDISQVGYDAEWHCISAAHVGMPHIRDRIWIIAYPSKKGLQGLFKPNTNPIQMHGNKGQSVMCINRHNNMGVSCIPEDIRMDDGLPNRVDRVKSLGNSIVPQVASEIFKAIAETENAPK